MVWYGMVSYVPNHTKNVMVYVNMKMQHVGIHMCPHVETHKAMLRCEIMEHTS
jgi:hypothetical protein